MSDDKIEKIRITLALNAKQIAERMLSGEVTSDSDFVSQEDHQHVARRLLDLLAASHREIAKLRAALGSEVLASHQGSPQREWHSGGAWLYPGDSINVVRAPLPEIRVEP